MFRLVSTMSLMLFFTTAANADFFKCVFGESETVPVLMISDRGQTASVLDYFNEQNRRGLKVLDKTSQDGVVTYQLAEGHKVVISMNTSDQNDGDVYFPYKAKIDGASDGACVREGSLDGMTVERVPSLNSATGLSWVDFWPGEYGGATGYKTTKAVVIPPSDAWQSVLDSKPAQKSCSLEARKIIVPVEGAPGESFHSLYPTAKFIASYDDPFADLKIGDEATLVSYLGEGYCLVEADGKMEYYSCPEGLWEDPNFPGTEGPGRAPYGNYAFLKCQEGHYTWISSEIFEADPETFEYQFLGF